MSVDGKERLPIFYEFGNHKDLEFFVLFTIFVLVSIFNKEKKCKNSRQIGDIMAAYVT